MPNREKLTSGIDHTVFTPQTYHTCLHLVTSNDCHVCVVTIFKTDIDHTSNWSLCVLCDNNSDFICAAGNHGLYSDASVLQLLRADGFHVLAADRNDRFLLGVLLCLQYLRSDQDRLKRPSLC